MIYKLRLSKSRKIIDEISFKNKKQAEAFIRKYLQLNGLDWRSGSLFKARNDKYSIEVIDKKGNFIKMNGIKTPDIDEYDPEMLPAWAFKLKVFEED